MSSKRIPLAVDESSISHVTNQNDSILNESGVSDLSVGVTSKLTLNGHANASADCNGSNISKMNGHHDLAYKNRNGGQINYTFDSDCKTTAPHENGGEKKHTSAAANGFTSPKANGIHQNGHATNGHLNHHHHHHNGSNGNGHAQMIGDEDDMDMAPQKASSPLVKANGTAANTNGHGINGSARHNKVE